MRLQTRAIRIVLSLALLLSLLSGCDKEKPKATEEAPKTRVRSLSDPQTSSTRPAGRANAAAVKNEKNGSSAAERASAEVDTFSTSEPHTIVTGKVLLPDGKPAASANVELGGYDYNEDTGETGTPIVAQTSSTADGKFKLVGRGLRSHFIRAHQAGYATVQKALTEKGNRAWDAELPALRKLSEDVTLLEAAAIRGHVIDDKEQPVAGATIKFSAGEVGKNYAAEGLTTTSAAGDFVLEEVAAGERMLMVDSQKHVPFSQSVVAPTSGVLVLRLQSAGAVVTGHAFMKGTGESLSSVTVTMNFSPKDYKIGPRYAPFKGVTDSGGVYEITRLPAGKYRFDAADLERNLGLAPTGRDESIVEIADKETTEINVVLYGGHAVYGTVSDKETSLPIEGAKVSGAGRASGRRKKNSVLSNADGSYRLTGVMPYGGGRNINFSIEKAGYKVADRNNNNGNVWMQVDPEETEARKDIPMLKSVNVTGIVKTKDGVPIPTAKVQVFDRNNMGGNTQAVPVRADGKYLLEVSRFSLLRVKAEAPGFPAGFSDPVQVEDKSAENVDITLEPGGTIAGTVVDPQGQPVADANVSANQMVSFGNSSGSDQSGTAKSDAAGQFTLNNQPKSTSLSATKAKYATSKTEAVQLDPGGVKSGIVLQLRVPHFIGGKVTTTAGDPVKDVQVSASGNASGSHGNAQTDETGRYKVEDLAEGTYYVYAYPRSGGSSMNSKQNIAVDRNDVDFILDEKTGVTMIGKLVDDKTGAPIKDFTCNSSGFKKDPAVPGRFTIPKLQAGVTHGIKLEVQGWPPTQFSVEVPKNQETFEKEFRMGPGGTITGRVVAKDGGKALPGVKVMLWGSMSSWERQQSMPMGLATTDEDGKFSVGPGPAGKNSLVIKPEAPLVVVNKEADIKNFETTDLGDIPVSGGGTVRVRVVRGAEEAPVPEVELTLRENSNYEQMKPGKTGADGVCTFASIPAGRYRIQSTKPVIYASADVKDDETKEIVMRLGSGKLIGKALKGGAPVIVSASISQGGTDQSQNRSARSEADGSFTFDDLIPGTCSVSLSMADDYNIRMSESVDIPESGAVVEKTFVFPNGSITGTVTDAAGLPVNGARVAYTPPTTGVGDIFATNRGGQSTNSDVKGTFSFKGLKAGTYTVTASKPEAGLATQPSVQVSDTGETKVDLRLEQSGGTVESVALDIADGKPIQKAWCYLNGPNGFLDHGQTRGADGIIKIPNVPPGTYQVQISAWGYSIIEKSIEVKQGETTHIDDVLYGAGSMRWILKDKAAKPIAGATCKVVAADANSMEAPREGKTDDQGQFTARGMAAGQYNAVAEVAGHASPTQVFNIKVSSHDEKVTVVE
ncbi:MAG: carboxypeptidase regulatory-like domain-containing protein [Candidatus Sumerlaeaceae bacterium]